MLPAAHTHPVRSRRGFTLLELIVVIAVLGILAAIAFVGYQTILGNTAEKAALFEQRQIARAVVAYQASDPTLSAEDALDAVVATLSADAPVGVSAAATPKYSVVFDTASTGPSVISATVSGGYLGWVVPALDDASVACRVKDRGVQAHCWIGELTMTYDEAIEGPDAEPAPTTTEAPTTTTTIDPNLPGAPTIVANYTGYGTVAFDWAPPAEEGATPITSYEITVTGPGYNQTFSSPAAEYLGAYISGGTAYYGSQFASVPETIVDGETYQVSIRAVNDAGPGPAHVFNVLAAA